MGTSSSRYAAKTPVNSSSGVWSRLSSVSARSADPLLEDPLDPVAAVAAKGKTASSGVPLSITTRIEYSALPKGEQQAVFGLVTVQAANVVAAAAAERQPMDLICVLDVSGSMSGNKIQEVKSAVQFITQEALPQDRLSLVTFNHGAKIEMGLKRMNQAGKQLANSVTAQLSASGGTSIAQGLGMGLEVAEQRRQRNKITAILLLTDGQDSSASAALPDLMNRAAQAGCAVYAFGFGTDHDAEMMRQISELARTPYSFIESTDTIREAFAGVVGGLSSIVAQNVTITLSCSVALQEVSTAFDVVREGDRQAIIRIPDIFAGERRDILVELSVPADLQSSSDDGTVTLLEASAEYLNLCEGDGVLAVVSPVPMIVTRVDAVQPELEPDPEVQDQRQRVVVTRALETATARCNEGHFDQARELLDQHLSEVTKRKTKIAEALSKDLQDAQQRMRDRAIWEEAGRAEVEDTYQMHKVQRCTNNSASRSSAVQKCSKAMYFSPIQEEWSSKARGR